MRATYFLLILLLFPSVGKSDTSFSSREELSQWLTFYYLKPEPERLPSAVRYMSKSGLLDNRYAFSPLFGFLASVFAENPDRAVAWAQELQSLKSTHYVVVVLGLWYANLPQSRQVVYQILDSDEALQESLAALKQGEPISIGEIPLQQGAWVLDALWGEFFATGQSQPVSRIAEALSWMEVEGDSNRLAIGFAADWSLRSNAVQHDRVFDIIFELSATHPDDTNLLEAVNDAKARRAERAEKGAYKDASYYAVF